jgi:hypothetical protein
VCGKGAEEEYNKQEIEDVVKEVIISKLFVCMEWS